MGYRSPRLGMGLIRKPRVLFLFLWALRVSPAVEPRRTVAAVALLIACFVTAAIGLQLRNAWIDHLYTHVNSRREL